MSDGFINIGDLKSRENTKLKLALKESGHSEQDKQQTLVLIKNHFCTLFQDNPEVKSYLISNQKNNKAAPQKIYFLRITREKIDYREKDDQQKNWLEYDFDLEQFRVNHQIKDPSYYPELFNRLKKIGNDLNQNTAFLFKELRISKIKE